MAAWIFKNIHEIPSLQLGKTLVLKFHEYSRIFKRPIPASFFKLIQAVEIPWIFKNIQAHKSWKFLEIPSSIFLQVKRLADWLLWKGTLVWGPYVKHSTQISEPRPVQRGDKSWIKKRTMTLWKFGWQRNDETLVGDISRRMVNEKVEMEQSIISHSLESVEGSKTFDIFNDLKMLQFQLICNQYVRDYSSMERHTTLVGQPFSYFMNLFMPIYFFIATDLSFIHLFPFSTNPAQTSKLIQENLEMSLSIQKLWGNR